MENQVSTIVKTLTHLELFPLEPFHHIRRKRGHTLLITTVIYHSTHSHPHQAFVYFHALGGFGDWDQQDTLNFIKSC
jgi:hypothetical protein